MRLALSCVLVVVAGCSMGAHDAATDASERADAGMHVTMSDASHPVTRRDAGHDAGTDAEPFDAGSDAGPTDGGPPIIPPNGPLTLSSRGGPVMGSTQLVTIDWSDFPLDDDVRRLGDFLPTSSWIDAVGSEYGVGLRGHSHFTIAGPTPASLHWADMDAVVDDGIASGRWPASPGGDGIDTIWMFFVPPDTNTDWDAAHSVVLHGATPRVLAVVVVLPPDNASMEWAASHETIEALTDPLFATAPAYMGGTPFEVTTYFGPLATEVADVCLGSVMEGGFTLTRSWSNAASLAGRSPCQPWRDGSYVGVEGPTDAVYVPQESTVTIMLDAVGDDPTAEFDVAITEGSDGPLVPSLGAFHVHVGDVVRLTLHVPTTMAPGPWGIRIDSRVGTTTVSACPIRVIPFGG